MMQRPHTHFADLEHLPKALAPITTLKRFVVWRWEKRRKKNGTETWTKPPYQCSNPQLPAKSNDPKTWGTYQEALAAVAAGAVDGIGLMLKGSELAAADLDHVRDVATGELLGRAKQMCLEAERLGLYVEITVSGCGLRFIGLSESREELHRKFTFNRKSGAGVELYRNCARYITISGLQQGASDELKPIDGFLDGLITQYNAPPPDPLDFNTAGPQSDYYQNVIENGAPEGERSERFQEVVWHLAASGLSAEQITAELAKHANGIGQKYAGRLLAEVTRSFGKWQRARQTAATGPGATSSNTTPWPQIQVKPGELPRVVNEAESALLLLGREIYQRGGMVVRPVLNRSLKASAGRETESWQLIPVTRSHLVEVLCCAAQFLRFDRRAKKWTAIDAPDKVADAYLNRQGRWKLPLLAGVINTPFLRADGSICETPGYDVQSHLLYRPERQAFPPVPASPSKLDAQKALEQLRRLIATFPFVTEADRSVALAGMLTVLDRRSLTTAPLIAFTSPAAGTGKSLLVDVMSVLATGRLMPVLSQGKNEEEFEKRLGASLLAGNNCISIDNCDQPLSGALLCQALTQGELEIRMLGYSRNVGTAMNASIFATGNNLEIAGDLTRRCLLASLDAGVERPELRSFSVNVIDEAHSSRGELVVAGLTVLRAWHVARMAGAHVHADPFGGFDDWSVRVREPLMWLGEIDPCETVAKVRENDPQRDQLMTAVMQWKENLILDRLYTVQNLIERAINTPSLHYALFAVAGARTGGMISNERLGRWLKRVEGKMVGGLKLVQEGNAHGYPLWKLTRG